ncbi:M6 family metalloprotease domain-containing protein [Candidatus Dependentiae bacterium]|nr:M6 family metalloprotease domain-containing protein [Candidatus Dependentiae bacterium]
MVFEINKKKVFFFTTFFFIFYLIPGNSFPPPDPKIAGDPEIIKLFNNHLSYKNETRKTVSKSPAYRSYQYPSALGTHKICVILLQFTNKSFPSQYNKTYYDNVIFNTSSNSLSNYYKECSYNKFNLSGSAADIYGPFTSSRTMEYYGSDGSDIDNRYASINSMIQEVVELAESSVNFSNYDSNGDGKVDHLIVIHAGGNQAVSKVSNDIWSHNWFINGFLESAYQTDDGVDIVTYSTFEEDASLGMMAHEFGHDLGLPDLYNTHTGNSVVGKWCLMDYGLYNGINSDGRSPAHPSVYNKILLNWITPVSIVSSAANYNLNNIEEYDAAIKIPHPSSSNSSQEYYLISNRQKNGYDSYLPGSGILVWHINDSIGTLTENNINNFSQQRVKIVPQDNTEPSWNYGDSTDPWKNNLTGLTSSSVPNNAAHNGQTSSTPIISNIGSSGDVMTLNFLSGYQISENINISSVKYNSGGCTVEWSINPDFSEISNISYYKLELYTGLSSSISDTVITTFNPYLNFQMNSPVSSIRIFAYNSGNMLITQSKLYLLSDTTVLITDNLIYGSSNITVISNDTVEITALTDYSGIQKNYILLNKSSDTFTKFLINSGIDLNFNINSLSKKFYINLPLIQKCNVVYSKPDNNDPVVSALLLNQDFEPNSLIKLNITDETNSIITSDFSSYFQDITFIWQDTSVQDITNYSLMYYNESTGMWEVALSSIEYDNNSKIIKGTINHLTMFAIKKVGSSLQKAEVFPNPHTPVNNGKIKFFYKDSSDTGFDFPINTSLKIYNISGELITEIYKTTDAGTGDPYDNIKNQSLLNWDLKNSSNSPVSSGVYLYVIETPSGKKFTGKCAVVR